MPDTQMADYLRFEIYVPRIYEAKPEEEGHTEGTVYSLDPELIQAFIDDTVAHFGGVMQANPYAPTPYKGWWHSSREDKIVVDSITYLLILVRIDQADTAIKFFTAWKSRLEAATHQDIILVTYYPVQVLGGFL
jgi:hypothetical protein